MMGFEIVKPEQSGHAPFHLEFRGDKLKGVIRCVLVDATGGVKPVFLGTLSLPLARSSPETWGAWKRMMTEWMTKTLNEAGYNCSGVKEVKRPDDTIESRN